MGNFNPKLPTKAVGTDKLITFFVSRNRRPTLADYRQPETGSLYSVGTVWQISKDPTTGDEGDLYMLSKIVANEGYWVLISSGSPNTDSVQVDASVAPGTNPVLATAGGLFIFNGTSVAAGTNPVRTISRAVNTFALEVQIAQAIAATDATKIGLSNFNSAHFTVDANGYVSSIAGVLVWIDQATGITLAVNTGYFVTAATTQTLPAAPTQGQIVKIVADTTGAVVVTANTGQQIRVGTTISSTAGTMTSTLQGDSLELIYRAASTTWVSIATTGVWVPA